VRDAWPESGRLAVLPVPLAALVAARVFKANGSTQAIDIAAFAIDAAAEPARLGFAHGALAAPERPVGGVEVDVTCGYGDTPGDVPEPLRQAIRMLAAHWYENRGVVAPGETVAQLPASVSALIGPYRVLAL
jgi:uncharacterized phiE125 gp8 family phage protein